MDLYSSRSLFSYDSFSPQILKSLSFLSKIKWKPQLSAVFAGKLDYSLYGRFDAFMIRLIMRMTDGPLETPEPIEFTDWEQVKKFAEEVGKI